MSLETRAAASSELSARESAPLVCSGCGWLVFEPKLSTGPPRCTRCNALAFTLKATRRALSVATLIEVLNATPERRARALSSRGRSGKRPASNELAMPP